VSVEFHAPLFIPSPGEHDVGRLNANSNENVINSVGNQTSGRQTHSWVIIRVAVGVLAEHIKQ
jgi:hypothetical protein